MQRTTDEVGASAPRAGLDPEREDDEPLDQTPPPDHEDWLAVAELGRRYTKMRWEKRRQMKLEREAREAHERLSRG